MDISRVRNRATQIHLLSVRTPQMRAFHMTWFAFFVSFFAWFAIAPLMAIVREDLELTRAQVSNTVIASVAATILARLVIGRLVDRFGPRRTYSALLLVGALPVMGSGWRRATRRSCCSGWRSGQLEPPS